MLNVLNDRVIIDSHEPTREQCETMTLLANALDKSADFETVSYVNGYAEFERVGRSSELRFVPSYTINIYSNDGSTQLGIASTDNIFKVVANGVEGHDDELMYEYSGSKTFLGLSSTPNARTAEHAVGTWFGLPTQGFFDYYIVEEGGGGSTMKSVDITTLPNYESIPLGTHKLTVTAQADGYTDSDPSAEVTFINGYVLTVQHDNCTYSPHQSMIAVFEDTVLTFTASVGYNLPDSVTVTGASYTWDKSTGKLTLSNVTGVVSVAVNATQPQLATPTNVTVDGTVLFWDAVENAESYDIYAGETLIGNTDGGGYSITVNITNGTYSGDSRVLPSGTAGVTITANDGYELPDTITVTGATGTWNKTTGTLSISNPTGNVTVTGECVKSGSGCYVYRTEGFAYPISVRINGTYKNFEDYEGGKIPLNDGDKVYYYADTNYIWVNGIRYQGIENQIDVRNGDISIHEGDYHDNGNEVTINFSA